MEFVDAPLWTEARLLDDVGIERLGSRLAALHALPVPGDLPDLDAFGIAAGYLAQLRQRNAAAAALLEPLVFEVQRLSVQLLALGLTNAQIARRCWISRHTVNIHVCSILAKFGAANRTLAVSLAYRQGLLATD